jgi:hypothetical protein
MAERLGGTLPKNILIKMDSGGKKWEEIRSDDVKNMIGEL